MNMFDLKNEVKVLNARSIASIGSDTTTAGEIIDCAGYSNVLFELMSGTRSAGTATPLIEWSDDSGMSGSEAVPDDFLQGTEAAAALSAANGRSAVGVIVLKRYIRLSIVTTGSTSAFILGATAILNGARNNPPA
jgi:hypothetical protein